MGFFGKAAAKAKTPDQIEKDALKERNNKLTKTAFRLAAKCGVLKKHLDTAKEDHKYDASTIKTLQEQKDHWATKIVDCVNVGKSIQESRETSEKEAAEWKALQDETERELNKIREAHVSAGEVNALLQTQNGALQSTIDELRTDRDQYKAAHWGQIDINSALRRENRDLQMQGHRLTSKVDDLEKSHEHLLMLYKKSTAALEQHKKEPLKRKYEEEEMPEAHKRIRMLENEKHKLEKEVLQTKLASKEEQLALAKQLFEPKRSMRSGGSNEARKPQGAGLEGRFNRLRRGGLSRNSVPSAGSSVSPDTIVGAARTSEGFDHFAGLQAWPGFDAPTTTGDRGQVQGFKPVSPKTTLGPKIIVGDQSKKRPDVIVLDDSDDEPPRRGRLAGTHFKIPNGGWQDVKPESVQGDAHASVEDLPDYESSEGSDDNEYFDNTSESSDNGGYVDPFSEFKSDDEHDTAHPGTLSSHLDRDSYSEHGSRYAPESESELDFAAMEQTYGTIDPVHDEIDEFEGDVEAAMAREREERESRDSRIRTRSLGEDSTDRAPARRYYNYDLGSSDEEEYLANRPAYVPPGPEDIAPIRRQSPPPYTSSFRQRGDRARRPAYYGNEGREGRRYQPY